MRPREQPDSGGSRGQFGVLSPHPQLLTQHLNHDERLGRLQLELGPLTDGSSSKGHFSNMKMDPNPSNLDEWRQKLFSVDEFMTLTEDEYAVALICAWE